MTILNQHVNFMNLIPHKLYTLLLIIFKNFIVVSKLNSYIEGQTFKNCNLNLRAAPSLTDRTNPFFLFLTIF